MRGPVGKLLSDPKRWTKGCFARNRKGKEVEPERRKAAVCFCVLGAVRAEYDDPDEGRLAKNKLRDALGVAFNMEISFWNDAPTTTHADLMAVLEKTGV